MKNNVKIYMCTHKPFDYVPPCCIPVAGGAEIKPMAVGSIPDYGVGGSISQKNNEYCELTIQYYAWKNEDCDYYGFCHYRRFFSFYEKTKKPYLVFSQLSEKNKKKLIPKEEEIQKKIGEFDVIVPKSEDVGQTVYEKYVTSAYMFKEDIDLFISLIKEKFPYLASYADEYMNQNKQYFCNMFIMKRELFFEYSEILFSLLFDFDKQKKLHGSFQADRTDGYLAERFLGIYLLYLKDCGKKIFECLRIDTEASLLKRIIFRLLPPESRLRFFFKKLFWVNRKKKQVT